MGRKKWVMPLFGLEVLAICGAAVFMFKGVSEIYVEAKNDASKEDETEEIQMIEEIAIEESDSTLSIRLENALIEKQPVKKKEVVREIAYSMDSDVEDAYLLEKIAMAEAESEDVEGKALVMLVVLNRVRSDSFPDTVKEVIYQKAGNGSWQFSPLQEGGRWYSTEPDQECKEALELIQEEKWDESQGALYFESAGNSEWHRKNLEFLFQYGGHYFYTNKELMK